MGSLSQWHLPFSLYQAHQGTDGGPHDARWRGREARGPRSLRAGAREKECQGRSARKAHPFGVLAGTRAQDSLEGRGRKGDVCVPFFQELRNWP